MARPKADPVERALNAWAALTAAERQDFDRVVSLNRKATTAGRTERKRTVATKAANREEDKNNVG